MAPASAIPDPALEAIRVATAALVSQLDRIVHSFIQELATDPVRVTPSQAGMRTGIANLDKLLADAGAKLAGVRDADAKLGLVRDSILDLIELAGAVRADLEIWSGNARPAPNEVHNRLVAFLVKIDRFEGGPRSGIDYAIREAMRRWARKTKPRVECDPTDRSVWLDGRSVVLGLPLVVFRFFQAIVNAYPEPISSRKIKGTVPGLHGKHPTRDFKDRLPAPLSEWVKSGKHGYHLELPQAN